MLTAVALEPEGVDTGEVTELVALEVELPELVAELVSEGCDEAPESVAADGNALGVKGPIEVPPVSELYVLTSRLAWEVFICLWSGGDIRSCTSDIGIAECTNNCSTRQRPDKSNHKSEIRVHGTGECREKVLNMALCLYS